MKFVMPPETWMGNPRDLPTVRQMLLEGAQHDPFYATEPMLVEICDLWISPESPGRQVCKARDADDYLAASGTDLVRFVRRGGVIEILPALMITILKHRVQKKRKPEGRSDNEVEIKDYRNENLEADALKALLEGHSLALQLIDEFQETRKKSGVLEWGPLPWATTQDWLRRILNPKTYTGVAEQVIAMSAITRIRRLSSPHRVKWYARQQFERIGHKLRGLWSMFVRFCRGESLLLPFNRGDGDEVLAYQAAREAKQGINPPTFVTHREPWPKAIALVDQRNEAAKKFRGRERFASNQYWVAVVRAYCRVLGGGINWGAVR